ncbi:succinyldiaminopimelate transaminase [Candidatus Frankia nodulisporulans]|uniref:succinyldiaminopimelate transaminase n=1 Tax=Candidatus Frankia nodulisporulans TaxID=2060052 RepID=UPI001583904C|nr:succinyldiaminopimelate transaminase [Candidatus Frankia nodulisporulans]
MRLPDFPWDQIASYKEKASTHPYGLVDLSVGTPVDATPAVVQQALAGAADAPGYPQTGGTPDLREAAAGWLARRLGVLVDPGAILPVLGTKELVAQLPGQLGLEPGDRVWVPTPAYPTYEVGALLARCEPVLGPADGVTLVWLNSPGNPTGRVLTVDEMRAVVGWARERGVIVASDECYIELGWESRPFSVLHPDVCGGSHEGLLAVHSLSKRSNLAGYRAGFVTGDPELVDGLLGVRKHAGFMLPTPVQAAMAAAYADDLHVADQRARYANRRAVLAAALSVAGFTIDHSEAGLYLWATRGEDAWATLDALAGVGVLVAPGTFYGEAGRNHVRVALTAPDSQVATVPERMAMIPPVAHPQPANPQPAQVAPANPAAAYGQQPARPAGRPAAPQGYPPEGYAPEGYAPEGYAPEGYAPEGYGPEGYVREGYAPEGYPSGGYVPEGYAEPPNRYTEAQNRYPEPPGAFAPSANGYRDPREGHTGQREGYGGQGEGYSGQREVYSGPRGGGYAPSRPEYGGGHDERSGYPPRPEPDTHTGGYPIHPGDQQGRPGAYTGRRVPPRTGPGGSAGYEGETDHRYDDEAQGRDGADGADRPWNGEPDIR